MADLDRRYKTRFVVSASLYTPPASEQMEATASLDRLRTLLPRDIDPEQYPTLLFVAGNLAVGGVVNLNSDALTLEDTIATYRAFEWQLVDVEHLRSDLKGFIVKAGLSELGTDRLLTEEEARAAGKPVNVAIVVALWKVADADLCAFIQQMDAPASPDKGKLSFSFEVGFDDYDIVVLPNGASNLALASQIVTPDSPEFGRFDRLLRVNGGKGVFGKDSHVARILAGNILPLGAGIVTTPAAAVKGLTSITSNPHATDTVAAVEVDIGEIPLAAQTSEAGVYGNEEEPMATPSRQIKLSEGWQTRLAALQAKAGKEGNPPLENGVNITLSDGRIFSNVHVFDGQTLELDKELSMSGVVITDMTPGARLQADDQAIETPSKVVVYPTTSPEQQARDEAIEAQRKAGQNAAYTDASAKALTASIERMGTVFHLSAHNLNAFAPTLFDISANTSSASVSLSNPTISPMNLSELKQSLASAKTVEEAVANVTLFADAIAAASEKALAERTAAQDAAKVAQAAVDQIKADLATLQKAHNDTIAANQAKAAETAFNDHMTAVEATFDLDDEVRAEIVDEVKACATEEAFAKWITSAKKKMKGFMKKKAGDKAAADDDGDTDAKAKKAAQAALASAAANVTDLPIGNANSTFEVTASLREQMETTFAKNLMVGGKKVSEMVKK